MNIYLKSLQSAIFGIYIAETIDTVPKQSFGGQTPLGLAWTSEPVKVLGILFSYNSVGNKRKNFTKKVDNPKTKLAAWHSLELSLFGRCVIANTLGLSQIIYSVSMDNTPNK